MPSKSKNVTAAAADSSQLQTEHDTPMVDAPEDDAQNLDMASFPIGCEGQKIRILPGSSETAASFEFEDEDHTLGNALRYMIMKNPEVEFCGYSIPHPSEPKMNVRIQTYDGTTAFDALEKGFDDLMDLCDVVADKFANARAEFAAK